MSQTKKFILDIAPIARLPFAKQQFYSYLFDKDLPGGTLVMIPLFNRETQGIVLRSKPYVKTQENYELKNISKVLVEKFLTTRQLLLANQIAKYYLNSLGVVLKYFMPMRVTARAATQPTTYNLRQTNNEIVLTAEQQSAIQQITQEISPLENRPSNFLLHGPASSGKTEIYIHSILELRRKNPRQQFLILLPELTLAPQAFERYSVYFPAHEIVILHSKLGKGEFYQKWQQIQTGQAKIIIATRMGIFAPFQKLGAIFVDEEQDMSFKQWDANPRFDARLGAEFLAKNHQAKLVFGTATPRIETFHKTVTKKFSLLTLPNLPPQIVGRKKTTPDIEIVDMRKEKWTDFAGTKKPNHSLLSMRLQEEISYALSQKLQIILFVNHQGLSTFSVCEHCKTVLKCSQCDRAMVQGQNDHFKCLHCNFTLDASPACKSCKSKIFKNIGIGTQAVEKEIKKLFGKISVTRLDSAIAKKPGAIKEVYADFMQGEIDILIGTQMITKGWDNPRVGLVAIIDSDSLFSSPDYLTDERAYSNIMQVAGRTGRVGNPYPGHVIIQTFNPNQPTFSFITSRNYPAFYAKEISQREALSYPPLGQIIKLSFKDEDKKKVEKNTLAVYEKISHILLAEKGISLTEPSNPLVSKIRGKFIKQMILKIKKNPELQTLPPELLKILGSLGNSWSIDVDPISIA
jgi:primosomal protein N' (replication factor Y)